MSQANISVPNRRLAALATLLRLWPLHLVVLCAVYVLGEPALRMARMALAGAAEGGIQVDTSGADSRMSGGRYVLDLPVGISNRGADMVVGVSLWVETFACPASGSPTAACRKLTAFEQYVPVRIHPGSSTSLTQSMDGVAPREGEVIRIRRKLQAIDNGEAPAS